MASKSEIPSTRTILLSNGTPMPSLALGTAPLSASPTESSSLNLHPQFTSFLPERVYRSTHVALQSGLRHIDTALCYRTHKQVAHVLGDFLARGELERRDVFLTSKVFHPHTNGFTTGSNDATMPANLDDMSADEVTEYVTKQFETTLCELGVGYVDLMLLHWPGNNNVMGNSSSTGNSNNSNDDGNAARRLAAWKVLEHMYSKGWARAIGVSNFNEKHLSQLERDGAEVTPMVNQIEASVFLQHDRIVEYCQRKSIISMAYSPLGRGVNHVTTNPVVNSVAEKHGKNAGQVALKYLLQKGYAVVFWSQSEDRIVSNQDLYGFALDVEDLNALSLLNVPDGTWGLPSPYDIR